MLSSLIKKNDTIVSCIESTDLPIITGEKLVQELDIHNTAANKAKHNEPRTADTFDSNEQLFSSKIREKAIQATNKADQVLSSLKSTIEQINFTAELEELKLKKENISNDLSIEIDRSINNIVAINEEYEQAKRDLDDFKRVHQLQREASYPESWIKFTSVLILALFIESMLNGFFFAEGSNLGLVGGISEAFIISAINIGFGCFFGALLRYKNHRNLAVKIFTIITFLALLYCPVLFNALVAHYREAFVIAPENATHQAWLSFKASALGIGDAKSWFLFATGMLFHLIAIYKGYHSDDTYPGYGKKARIIRKVEDEFFDERDHAREMLNELIDDFDEALEKNKQNAQVKLKNLNTYCDAFDSQQSIVNSYLRDLNQKEQYIIMLYREINTLHRSDDPPAFFNNEITSNLETLPKKIVYEQRVKEEAKIAYNSYIELLPQIKSELINLKAEYSQKIEKAGRLL